MSPLFASLSGSRRQSSGRRRTRPTLEVLEDRTVPTAVAPPPGLISWWTADNTAADLIGGNDATLINGTTFAGGEVRQAFSFDGVDDRAQLPDASNLALTESLTIEAWIRLDAITGGKQLIFFRGDDRNGLDPYRLEVWTDGALRFHLESLSEQINQQTPSPLAVGQFVHVAGTLEDATGLMRLYVDGALAAETTTSIRPFGDLEPASNPGLGIGSHSGYPFSPHSYLFHGMIDEVSVYNRALTPTEIQDIYGAGTDGKIKPIKFFVTNDGATNQTFEYSAVGASGGISDLTATNSAPRGAASNAAGDRVWVVDANKNVYVYNPSGGLLGSWTAGGMHAQAQVEGITTNGTDIWLVDNKQDKVFKYTGAASRLSGSQNAASSFNLNGSNTNPKDLVTDGASLWVVNDSTTDKVFKYTLSGSLLGSWTVSTSGVSSPTGITLDPTSVNHLWIVDNGTDRVYQYDNAASRTSGSQSASTSFALAAGNTNPQGIADPPAARTANGRLPKVKTPKHDVATIDALFAMDALGRKRPRIKIA